jgi:hypothetical protein
MKMEETVSETLAYKIQTPGNYPEETIQHSEQSESLKSRILSLLVAMKATATSPFHQTLHTHIPAGKCTFISPIPVLLTCLMSPASLTHVK